MRFIEARIASRDGLGPARLNPSTNTLAAMNPSSVRCDGGSSRNLWIASRCSFCRTESARLGFGTTWVTITPCASFGPSSSNIVREFTVDSATIIAVAGSRERRALHEVVRRPITLPREHDERLGVAPGGGPPVASRLLRRRTAGARSAMTCSAPVRLDLFHLALVAGPREEDVPGRSRRMGASRPQARATSAMRPAAMGSRAAPASAGSSAIAGQEHVDGLCSSGSARASVRARTLRPS